MPQFKRLILNFIRPKLNSIFDICDSEDIKLLTRLRLGLSHLNKHKFSHGFLDTINPMCNCNTEEESTSHYLLRCSNFAQIRIHLMNEMNNIDQSLILSNDNVLCNILLFGDEKFDYEINSKILQ